MWRCSAKLKNLRVTPLIQLQPCVISNDSHWLFGSQSKHIYFFVYPQSHKVTYGGSTLPKKYPQGPQNLSFPPICPVTDSSHLANFTLLLFKRFLDDIFLVYSGCLKNLHLFFFLKSIIYTQQLASQ